MKPVDDTYMPCVDDTYTPCDEVETTEGSLSPGVHYGTCTEPSEAD